MPLTDIKVWLEKTLPLLLWCALLTSAALAHAQQGQPAQQTQQEKMPYALDRANVPDAIVKIKSGDFAAVHVDLISRAGATEAIPALQEQFPRIEDSLLKAKIAAALLRFGEKDDTYWRFLVELATPVLQSDAPDFMSYDAQGKSIRGPSPEFLVWLKAHNVSTDSAGENSVYIFPGMVALLGWSHDPRAIPLLRKGLSSPNHMIEIAAASGLAEIGDSASIPAIIEACRRAPAEAAVAIAEALVYFDDSSAQAAVDQFIPANAAKVYRDARAHGKRSPFSVPLNN